MFYWLQIVQQISLIQEALKVILSCQDDEERSLWKTEASGEHQNKKGCFGRQEMKYNNPHIIITI